MIFPRVWDVRSWLIEMRWHRIIAFVHCFGNTNGVSMNIALKTI